jgi:hypothetical protein
VRQVRARFSEPMVPFADPRAAAQPFVIDCAEKGTGRWVDARNWVYDFERDLPAGIRCEFRIQDSLRNVSGRTLGGEHRFAFSTGGPAIIAWFPPEGSERIDEAQIFVLELDGEATESSPVMRFDVEGLAERIGARIVSGTEREQILTCIPDICVSSCLPQPIRSFVLPFPPVGPGSPGSPPSPVLWVHRTPLRPSRSSPVSLDSHGSSPPDASSLPWTVHPYRPRPGPLRSGGPNLSLQEETSRPPRFLWIPFESVPRARDSGGSSQPRS